jgi:FkbM family methyltransferase
MSSVCVLGAGGFVGRNLIEMNPDWVGLTRGDLNLLDSAAVDEYFKTHTFDVVVHCAVIGGSRLQPDGYDVTFKNILMFNNIVQYLHKSFKKFIYFSSGASLQNNMTSYGLSKRLIEDYIDNIPDAHYLRIWGCYGPHELPTRFSAMCKRDGHVVIQKDKYFDFVSIEYVNKITQLYVSGKINNKCFNLVDSGPKKKLSEWAPFFGAQTYEIVDQKELDEPYADVKMFGTEGTPRYMYEGKIGTTYVKDRTSFFNQFGNECDKFLEFDTKNNNVLNLTKNNYITYKNYYNLKLLQGPLFEYPPDSFDVYLNFLDPTKNYTTVFDCGACFGLDSILFHKTFKSEKVVCLEPDYKNYDILIQNTCTYKGIIHPIKKALFCHDDTVQFSCENTQGSMVIGKEVDNVSPEDLKKLRVCGDFVDVECTTINSLIWEHGKPDIIKIDIEGSEYDLPKNDSMGILRDLNNIVIIMELHGNKNDELIKYIESLGFRVIKQVTIRDGLINIGFLKD